MPDAAYISLQRLPNGLPTEAIASIAPQLAVEVLCASNTTSEMTRKRKDYFDSGVKLLWIVDPETRTIDVYTASDRSTRLHVDDSLDGGDVLYGFTASVAELFAPLGPDARG
jgi:Uma2 family endonuclease